MNEYNTWDRLRNLFLFQNSGFRTQDWVNNRDRNAYLTRWTGEPNSQTLTMILAYQCTGTSETVGEIIRRRILVPPSTVPVGGNLISGDSYSLFSFMCVCFFLISNHFFYFRLNCFEQNLLFFVWWLTEPF